MALIKKLEHGTNTIYPATIPQAVVDHVSGKSVRTELDERANHGYESNPKSLKEVDDEKADHGYAVEETPKTLKEVDTLATQNAEDITQLAGEVSLLDAVHSDKIKDIENVISTMNPNQSAQLSVSGRKVVSLPKNAANGGMQVKLEGLTATNLINGRGDNLDGWSNAVQLEIVDGWFRQVNEGVRPSGLYPTNLSAGDKIYIYFEYFLTGAPSRPFYGLNLLVDGSISASSVLTPLVAGATAETWVSGIVLAPEGANGIGFTWSGSLQTKTGDVFFRRAKAINLTATFGAGNEPDRATCDAMFSDYFDGVKSFVPTGRVRSVDKNGINPTALYLTAPVLRSNGTVKDEIRKGSNGYELVKRVGVGTLVENIVGGDFEGGLIGTNDAEGGSATWVLNTTSPISGTKDGRLVVSSAGTLVYKPRVSFPSSRVSGQWRILTFDYRVNSGACRLYAINIGSTATSINMMLTGSGKYKLIYKTNGTTDALLSFDGTSLFDIQIDNISDKMILGVDGAISDTSTFTELSDGTILYTLATPVISPISYGGILNSAENGTVYHEPIIADAGVYGTNMPILLTDYPIASLEEIIKHENGVDTYLNVATAVIASDGLSFTHPDLASGDLVLFTYAFDKESTNGNITATFYDSNVVKIDTVTGKAYKITDVVTNGVLTRTLTEV